MGRPSEEKRKAVVVSTPVYRARPVHALAKKEFL
jgi:hypothetical protein